MRYTCDLFAKTTIQFPAQETSKSSHEILKCDLNPLKVINQRLCSHCDVSRRADVHGAEEAFLSAHLATGLDRPPLEAVLRCPEAAQSS